MSIIINVDCGSVEAEARFMIDTTQLAAAPLLSDAVGVDLGSVAIEVDGSLTTWRGPLAVEDVAVSSVMVALAAAAELLAERNGTRPRPVRFDARHASMSFLSESLVAPQGWRMPPVWDPIAGDYSTADGWIRLHTNYPHHRAAALSALALTDEDGLSAETVAGRVRTWITDDLEAAVVAAQGVAGGQRTMDQWHAHPAGSAVEGEPLLAHIRHDAADSGTTVLPPATRPFEGIRVLDLTRVLAGPTATGFMAAWGAEVLRIDPPGFEEAPAIVPITTSGKQTTSIDLADPAGRQVFLRLLAEADVVVHGYRGGALAGIGLDPAEWPSIRPGIVVAGLTAYGWSGPWCQRRGFDSIVQHSSGITRLGQDAMGAERPVPLPCQALDHGCGWLLAAGVARALTERCRTGRGDEMQTSLARFAHLLTSLPQSGDLDRPAPAFADAEPFTASASTPSGPLRRLTWPGSIDGIQPLLGPASTIGSSAPAWTATE